MDSYIITDSGVSLCINSTPFVVSKDHENFGKIMDAVRAKQFDVIPALVNKLYVLKDKYAPQSWTGDVIIDVIGGIVTCQGTEIPSTLAKRLIRMVTEGFDVAPLSKFISNLFNNPSNRTIEELYTFLEYGQLPITEDGCFVAYKKVNGDYTDCHTHSVFNKPASLMTPEELLSLGLSPMKAGSVTTRLNEVGETEVSMPRRSVDDRSENTCSRGLHFCSFEYLKSFSGSRVIVVKINPADVVSIPVDYNNTKGRTCKYVVVGECTDNIETVFDTPVYGAAPLAEDDEEYYDSEDYSDDGYDEIASAAQQIPDKFEPSANPTVSEEEWYLRGHSDGRKHENLCTYVPAFYLKYYDIGYLHGRGKKRKLYGGKKQHKKEKKHA